MSIAVKAYTCLSCSAENAPDSEFCKKCGTKIVTTGSTSPYELILQACGEIAHPREISNCNKEGAAKCLPTLLKLLIQRTNDVIYVLRMRENYYTANGIIAETINKYLSEYHQNGVHNPSALGIYLYGSSQHNGLSLYNKLFAAMVSKYVLHHRDKPFLILADYPCQGINRCHLFNYVILPRSIIIESVDPGIEHILEVLFYPYPGVMGAFIEHDEDTMDVSALKYPIARERLYRGFVDYHFDAIPYDNLL